MARVDENTNCGLATGWNQTGKSPEDGAKLQVSRKWPRLQPWQGGSQMARSPSDHKQF